MSTGDRIKNLRQRVRNSEEIDDRDRELLIEFSDRLRLLAQQYSDHRHEKLLRHMTIIAESCAGGVVADSLTDRDAAETIVGWINREYDNEETNRDYRSALRVFGRRVTDGDDTPASMEWIPTSTSSDYDPTPDPREMLRWDEDILPMMDEAINNRDAAMVALQFDAGLRGGEFKSLSVGDIQDHDHGLQVTVEGKQGRRTVLLIPSVPWVNRWLADHPGDDPDDPLWSKLDEADGISDRMISQAIDRLAENAGVDKPVTLTNFRKSSAAFLASRNLNQAHIEDHHGWVRGSDAAARYISVFGESSDRELASLHGKDVSGDEPDDIAPLECPRCERETPRDEPLCVWCGQAMDQGAAADIEDTEAKTREALAELDPEKAEQLIEVAELLEEPEIRSRLLDR